MVMNGKMSVLGAVALAGACAFAESAEKLSFEYTLNRTNGLYAVGEQAEVSILVKDRNGAKPKTGKLTVEIQRMIPGQLVGKPQEYDLAKTNPIVLEPFTCETRDSVRVCVRGEGSDGHYNWINPKSCFAFGLGFGLDGIRPATPKPVDFAAFWQAAVRKAEETIPLDVKTELRPEESKGNYNFHSISFAGPDRRVYGYFSVPKDASAAKRYPARVEIPGAGWGGWSNERQGSDREIRLFLYVYPFQPVNAKWKDQTAVYTNHVAELRQKYGFFDSVNPQYAGMAVSREESYFYPVLVTDVRAVKWLAGLDYVDATRISYDGHSQGGGLGLALVGLCDGLFHRARISCPALCDLMGYKVGRPTGWPGFHTNYPEKDRPALERNMPYFDAANFASLVHCPVRVAVGMVDSACMPTSVYAAFNAIPSSDKMIVNGGLEWGHGVWCEDWNRWDEWLTK